MLRGQSYTLKQVKDATRNFSRKNEIGKGRYGIVYKVKHGFYNVKTCVELLFLPDKYIEFELFMSLLLVVG